MDTLLSRNKSRALEDMETFIQTSENAPRLPNINETEYKSTLLEVISVFNAIVDNKLTDLTLPDMRVIVFDNSKVLKRNAKRECIIDIHSKALKSQNTESRKNYTSKIKEIFRSAWFPPAHNIDRGSILHAPCPSEIKNR